MKLTLTGAVYGVALAAMLAMPMASQAADDKMMAAPAKMDCSKAESMMKSGMTMAPMKMTGDVDQDFAMMAVAHAKMMSAMAKIEAACGKNAKLKAEAMKMMAMEAKEIPILEPFRSP